MNKIPRRLIDFMVLVVGILFILSSVQDASAQYFSFGKNRVQYKTFDWRYIQSDHFDVYYYQTKNYDLANFTAISLEASLQQLQEDFRHQIADRIQVIIYDSHTDFSQTNVVALPVSAEGIGGVTDPFKNRITMPFKGDYREFRDILQHELVHAVINDMFYGGNVQSIVSGDVQLRIPTWFNEGLAEYESLAWDTSTDMFIRDAIINDYLPPISRLSGFFVYRGGQSIWNYIVEEYGREKIGEIMQALKSTQNVNGAFLKTIGLSLEELSKRWKDYYRRKYLPEVAEREKIDDFSTVLTGKKGGSFNTSPSISPQGDKVAMVTNERGFFDVVVVSAVTGEKLKTLIKGGDNVNFEEFNILKPNLSWSPDGQKIALSTKSKGSEQLAIVDYNTGKVKKIEFPRLDALGSVAWSPDGKKIAFDGNIGSMQDIYVYNIESREFINVTHDAISDYEPAWAEDSETIYFTSARGDKTTLDEVRNNVNLLENDYFYTTDIYSVKIGSKKASRLTKTPFWNESQPSTTTSGRLVYISDKNGINNVYELDLDNRTSSPLTNLQTGVLQMSVSSDGSRMAVNSINDGTYDVFVIRTPFVRAMESELNENYWAKRRIREPLGERVPATKYVRQLLGQPRFSAITNPSAPEKGQLATRVETAEQPRDTTRKNPDVPDDSVDSDTTQNESDKFNFRNYVFEEEIEEDTTFTAKYLEENVFKVENNKTEDGRYQPRDYRLKFTTDLVYAGGTFSTTFGSYGLTQIIFSDLLGNHQIAFGSNLVVDLRNSNYFLQYGYLKQRTNWLFNFFHSSQQFQTFSGQLFRFRTLGGGVTARYPIDKFRRIDFSLSGISISQDFSEVGRNLDANETSSFLYPQVIYTSDNTLPGFLTPRAGSRYSISLTGSPPLSSNTLQFGSVLGDYRKYINLGQRYSFAVRGSGAASFGRDSQTFFMGGMLGWINREFSGNSIPVEKLGESFFAQPALPLRGYPFNETSGDKFGLVNLEFRFPLFAAILPGPIPVLPLYNLTGVAFIDAGAAWGEKNPFEISFSNGRTVQYGVNEADLNFKIRQEDQRFIELNEDGSVALDDNGNPIFVDEKGAGKIYEPLPLDRGDVLIGAGFGLRSILLGLPIRYDIGWPYMRDGFKADPVHYFSIGIDF